jgi:metal-responsive CopG/Arc/MetJ family transcriptional regulator
MTPLSIKLPDKLASASQQTARKLGISRSELIRLSLEHEIERIEADLERREMAQSLTAMANSPVYMRDAEILDDALDEPLADEQDNWWKN